MPAISLTFPAQGDLAWINRARVGAMMLWPSEVDKNEREAAVDTVAKSMVINFAKVNPDLPIGEDGAEALEWLRSGPPLTELTNRAKRRYYEGILVGDIVLRALSPHQETGQPLLLNQIKQSALEHYGKLKLGSPELPNFDNQIWPRMKPVAHFWAAHIRLGLSHGGLTPPFPCLVDDLQRFLINADALLNEATQIKLRRSRDQLLNPDDAWTIHSTIVSSSQ
jgi:hypothetical protein